LDHYLADESASRAVRERNRAHVARMLELLRAGQAVPAKRSDLVLEPVGGFGLGLFL